MPEISTALIIKIIVIAVAIGGGIAVIYSEKSGIEHHWQTTEPCQRPAKDHK